MFKKVKIRIRLIIYISALLVAIMALMSSIIFRRSKDEIQNRLAKELTIINDLKMERIVSYFDNVDKSINQIEYDSELDSLFADVVNLNDKDVILAEKAQKARVKLQSIFLTLERTYGFNRIMLRSLDGYPLVESRRINAFALNDSLLYKTNSHIFIDAQTKNQYTDIYHPIGREDSYFITILAPYYKFKKIKEPIAIICCEMAMNPIYKIVEDTTGLGETGETILTKKVYNQVHFISRPRDFSGDFLALKFNLGDKSENFSNTQLNLYNSEKERDFKFEVIDHNETEVDASWDFISGVDWGVVTKMDHKESFSSIQYLRAIILMLSIGIVFFSVIIITIFVEKFLTPIINIRDNLVSLAKGDFPKKLYYDMNDEINDTTLALNNLVDRLKNSTDFAQEICSGNLGATFKGRQTQDVLTKSLLTMQESLKEIEEENNRRKWATEGFVIHGELFRKNSTEIDQLGDAFICSLVPYINGIQGLVYSISHSGSSQGRLSLEQEDSYFELIGRYALEIKDDTLLKFKIGQGIPGQCVKEKRAILVENVPNNSIIINSGLGKSSPSYLVCVPMLLNNQVMGVVEITSFTPFESYVIEFIETLGESFASAVLRIKTNYQTHRTIKEYEANTTSLMFEIDELQERNESALKEIKKLREALKLPQESTDE